MTDTPQKKKHILVVSQYFYPEAFRINDMCAEWGRRGYKITVLTGIPNYPYGRYFDGYGLFKRRRESCSPILRANAKALPFRSGRRAPRFSGGAGRRLGAFPTGKRAPTGSRRRR